MPDSTDRVEFRIRYGGKLHQIDSNTLINSLINTTAALQEINEELIKESNIKGNIQIKINAFSRGSFLVELQLLQSLPTDLFAALAPAAVDIKAVIDYFIEFIKLKRFLRGEKPRDVQERGNKYKITDNKGNVNIFDKPIFNIYSKNTILNEAFNGNFEALLQDEAISGFDLTDDKGKVLIETSKNDFKNLAQRNELLEEKTEINIDPKANLNIIKPAFVERYKWQFYYQGIPIYATIADEKYLKRIDKGEQFAKGDVLVVRLEIEKVFDPGANTYVNRSYKILEVLEHKLRDEQQNLLT